MLSNGYAERFFPPPVHMSTGAQQAHSAYLQTFAEVGIIGGLAFVAMFVVMAWSAWRSFRDGNLPYVSLGWLFALASIGLRLLTDDLMDFTVSAERIRVLVWVCFGLVIAISRLHGQTSGTTAPLATGRYLSPRVLMVVVILLAVEGYALFVKQHGTFAISGRREYEIAKFADGATVRQAFLMRGAGLNALRVSLVSETAARVRLRWVLWRGMEDVGALQPAAGGEEDLELSAGRQWPTLNVVRDRSSHDRWYTLELRLMEVAGAPPTGSTRPRVTIQATQDNPDRGGVLWVDERRLPGSLQLRADRLGPTIYRRFQNEVEPNLPPVFQSHAVQWLTLVLINAAFVRFAIAIASDRAADLLPPRVAVP
jgi:hypothetical protein